jgi:hypothetical protein
MSNHQNPEFENEDEDDFENNPNAGSNVEVIELNHGQTEEGIWD